MTAYFCRRSLCFAVIIFIYDSIFCCRSFFQIQRAVFGCLFSRNAKKAHIDQSTLQVFSLCLKRNHSQTFKGRLQKIFPPECACYRYNLLWWMFFIPCDNWKSLFFRKSLSLLSDSFSRHILVFFETSVLHLEVCLHFTLSPQYQCRC